MLIVLVEYFFVLLVFIWFGDGGYVLLLVGLLCCFVWLLVSGLVRCCCEFVGVHGVFAVLLFVGLC